MVKRQPIFQAQTIGINVQVWLTLRTRSWLLEAVGLKIITEPKFLIHKQIFGQTEQAFIFVPLGKASDQCFPKVKS